MKNLFNTILLALILSSCAGSDKVAEKPDRDIKYSILWGLVESENYESGSKMLDARRDSLKALRRKTDKDTASYEMKSYLWGAIKFSEEKK